MATIVSPSQSNPLVTIVNGSGTNWNPAPGVVAAVPTGDPMLSTFQFVVGWLLLITILVFANKSRVGHVIIYYSLILIILLILVTEYTQIVPYLNAIQTIGQFNPSSGKSVS